MTTLRCSAISAAADEPLAGTAPTDTDWLFVESPGPWGPKATRDLGLERADARVQLIRRHGRTGSTGARPGAGVRLFAVTTGTAVTVRTAVVGSLDEIGSAVWQPSTDPLLMVCTNGRRDRCCSELGRPVAAALAERWPDATWETTHLGGHRFAATLLALPSGIALGRLDADTAVDACAALLAGELPDPGLVRGRAGLPGAAQAAEHAVRLREGLPGIGAVSVTGTDGDRVTLATPAGPVVATVTTGRGEPRAQSCGDEKVKSAPTYEVRLEGS